MKELKKRLTDLQDIAIAIDEKLKRLESQSLVTLPTPPRSIPD